MKIDLPSLFNPLKRTYIEYVILNISSSVFDLIASHISVLDLCALRLVNLTFYWSFYRQFAARAVTIVRTDLSCESLSRLLTLAKDDNLREFIRGIRFRPNGVKGYGHGFKWRRRNPKDGNLNQAVGCDKAKDIFRKFFLFYARNCSSFWFELNSSTHGRDGRVNSDGQVTRLRNRNNDTDGMNRKKKSLPLHPIEALDFFIDTISHLHHPVRALILSRHSSQDHSFSPPPGTAISNCHACAPRIPHLNTFSSRQVAMGSSFSSLLSLTLHISLFPYDLDWFASILRFSPNLRHLSLRCAPPSNNSHQEHVGSSSSVIGVAEIDDALLQNASLCRLEELRLAGLRFEAETLVEIFCRSADKLRVVTFQDVTLVATIGSGDTDSSTGSSSTLTEDEPKNKAKRKELWDAEESATWKSVLLELSDIVSGLHSVHLSGLQEEDVHGGVRCVKWPRIWDKMRVQGTLGEIRKFLIRSPDVSFANGESLGYTSEGVAYCGVQVDRVLEVLADEIG